MRDKNSKVSCVVDMGSLRNYYYIDENFVNMFHSQIKSRVSIDFQQKIPFIGLTIGRPKKISQNIHKKISELESYILKHEEVGTYESLTGDFIFGNMIVKFMYYEGLVIFIPNKDSGYIKNKNNPLFIIVGGIQNCAANMVDYSRYAIPKNDISTRASNFINCMEGIVKQVKFLEKVKGSEDNYVKWFRGGIDYLYSQKEWGYGGVGEYKGMCFIRRRIKEKDNPNDIVILYPIYLEQVQNWLVL